MYQLTFHSLLLLSLAATLACCTPYATVLRLQSGRQIPVHLVRQRVRAPITTTTEGLSARVYEVSADGMQLTGVDRTVDLHSLTGASRPVAAHTPQLLVNGADHAHRLDQGGVRRGAGYTVAHMADGKVIGVWGNGLALEPLSSDLHPGVFINLRDHQAERTGDISEDAREVTDGMTAEEHRRFGWNGKPTADMPVQASASSSSCRRNSVTKELEVAITFDKARCKLYGNDKGAAILAARTALDEASKPFREQTCLRLKVVAVEAFCANDDDLFKNYDDKPSNEILDAFSLDWAKTREHIKRDIAIYLPGFEPEGSVSGVAWIGGACSTSFGYCWVANQEPLVMAHEIGHLLQADHVNKGLMQSSWSSGDKLRFAKVSIHQISDFVDNDSRSKCVTAGSDSPPTLVPTTTAFDVTKTSRATAVPTDDGGPHGTCGSGFDAARALTCTRRTVNIDLVVENENIGVTKLTVLQRFGDLRVKIEGKGDVRIRSLNHMLSFTPGLLRSDFRKGKIYPRKGRRVVLGSVDITSLQRPKGTDSCCGQSLYVYVLLEHCDSVRDVCATDFFSGQTDIECSECSSPSFLPMSELRKCPVC